MEPIDHEARATQVNLGERTLELPCPLSDVWRHEGALLVLVAPSEDKRELWIYDEASLERRHVIAEPKGWTFYRLANQVRGPSVVAITDDWIDGHSDWHFLIDLGHGSLSRTAPSR